ncbi:hypothetical protein [Pseudomonas fluorescens]|uniref:Uncharacterized protein n=1 Tax=Pseudomonas fluorescens TaxID=294 RepID=A0A5E7CV87_PSEFL|nr:hypothetical protein [Pseudomonas fluorescens]VVO07891.1 hypothetical protein PS691_03162 [Pseudomonas fluorescens]
MALLEIHKRFAQFTGTSWIMACVNSTRLQQSAIEAQIRYLESLGEASLERQQILEKEMKFRFDKSQAYWERMWSDLAACEQSC